MSIQSERALAATREKLRRLEERVTILKKQPAPNPYVRELTLRSLYSLIKQFREEIIRYEINAGNRDRVRSIHSELELDVTREKLRLLEDQVAKLESQPVEDSHVRDLSLRSLYSLIKQLKEEIILYEIKAGTH